MSQSKKPVRKNKETTGDRTTGEKGRCHLTKHDYGLLLDWLEMPGNREKLEGVEKKTKVGVHPMVRSKAYEEMAKHLNENQKKGSNLAPVDGKSMKTRWKHYRKQFVAAKEKSKETGFGLTDEDYALGITTIADKLEAECLWFKRMDNLFGKDPNVDPELWGQEQVGFRSALPQVLDNNGVQIAEAESGQGGHGVVDPLENDVRDNVYIPDTYNDDDPRLVPDSIPQDGEVRGEGLGKDYPSEETNEIPSDDSIGGIRVEGEGHDANMQRSQNPAGDHDPAPRAGSRPVDSEVPGQGHHREATINGGVADHTTPHSRPPTTTQDRTYPNKKQISESRHSINSAFATNLEVQNIHRERTNELRAQKLEDDRELEQRRIIAQQDLHRGEREDIRKLEEKKLQWERERFRQESEQRAEDRAAERMHKSADLEAARADRAYTEKLHLKQMIIQTSIQNNKSLDEIKAMLDLLG